MKAKRGKDTLTLKFTNAEMNDLLFITLFFENNYERPSHLKTYYTEQILIRKIETAVCSMKKSFGTARLIMEADGNVKIVQQGNAGAWCRRNPGQVTQPTNNQVPPSNRLTC